jgi:hypothetical protein
MTPSDALRCVTAILGRTPQDDLECAVVLESAMGQSAQSALDIARLAVAVREPVQATGRSPLWRRR